MEDYALSSIFLMDLYTNAMLLLRKVGTAAFAHLFLVYSLHLFDKRVRGFDFSEWLRSNPEKHDTYFAGRFIGLGILYGLIIAFV